jgi:hypothetical protein
VQAASKAAVVLSSKRFFMSAPKRCDKRLQNDKQYRCHCEGVQRLYRLQTVYDFLGKKAKKTSATPYLGTLGL